MSRVYGATVVGLCFASVLFLAGVVDEAALGIFFSDMTQLSGFGESVGVSDYAARIRKLQWAAIWLTGIKLIVYLSTVVVLSIGLMPKLQHAFASATASEDDAESGDAAAKIYALLRARSARRRSEAYTALVVGLLAVVVGIGFVTRGYTLPDVIESASMQDAVQSDLTLLLSDSALIGDIDLFLDAESSSDASLRAYELRTEFLGSIGSAYLDHEAKRLQIDKEAASDTLAQQTILTIGARISGVLLILALAQMLLRVYSNAIHAAQHLDAVADAIKLAGNDAEKLAGLRETIRVPDAGSRSTNELKHVIGQIESLIQRAKTG